MNRLETPDLARTALAAVVGVSVLLRLGFALTRPVDEAAMFRSLPDQREYLLLGRSLLELRSLQFTDDRYDQPLRAYRMPGYPLLVAACGGSVRAVQALQSCIDGSTVLAVFILARRWLTGKASLLAAGVVGVNPFLIFFSSLVLTETLFVAMLVWSAALLVRCRRGGFWVGVGLLAAAAHVRPSAGGLAIVLPAAAWILDRRADRQGSLVRGGIGGLALVLALLPWAVRNQRVLGEWVWTATNAGATLYDGFNPSADGSSDQSFLRAMPELRTMGEVERSRHLSRLAREYVSENPVRAVALAGAKLARTWSPIPLSVEYGGRNAYVIAAGGYAAPLFAMAIIGLLLRDRLPRAGKVFLILPAIYFSIGHAASVGSLRYRVPAEPFLAILAASVVSVRRDDASPRVPPDAVP